MDFDEKTIGHIKGTSDIYAWAKDDIFLSQPIMFYHLKWSWMLNGGLKELNPTVSSIRFPATTRMHVNKWCIVFPLLTAWTTGTTHSVLQGKHKHNKTSEKPGDISHHKWTVADRGAFCMTGWGQGPDGLDVTLHDAKQRLRAMSPAPHVPSSLWTMNSQTQRLSASALPGGWCWLRVVHSRQGAEGKQYTKTDKQTNRQILHRV